MDKQQKRSWPMSGELTRRIKFIENVETKVSGVVQDTPTEIAVRSAKRIEGRVANEEEGRLIGLHFISYQLRFDKDLFVKAHKLTVQDVDGDYDITGHPQILDGGRNRYMQINCRKRV